MVGARAFCSFFASLFLHQVLKAMQDLWEAGGRAGGPGRVAGAPGLRGAELEGILVCQYNAEKGGRARLSDRPRAV
jgi:hypothetical protein